MFPAPRGPPPPASLAALKLVLVLIEKRQDSMSHRALPRACSVRGLPGRDLSIHLCDPSPTHLSHTHTHHTPSRDRCLYSPGSKGTRVFPPLHLCHSQGLRPQMGPQACLGPDSGPARVYFFSQRNKRCD